MDLRNAVRALHRQGKGSKCIAHELQLARNTVRKYLRAEYPPQETRTRTINSALTPFVGEIKRMLTEDLNGSRILRELQAQGYTGPQRTFYRQFHKLQAKYQPEPAVERFETPPAKQGQFDWAEYAITCRQGILRVYVFDLILGYSRYQHFYPSLTINQKAVFEAFEDSFRHLNGVPREILIDNPRTMVLKPRPDLVWNPRFKDFADHYGFKPIACWPYRAQTKGKVENPFRFLEEQFIKGTVFADFADFRYRLADFADQVVNVRIHGTTRERPCDRRLKEQSLLTPLPEVRFIAARELFRHVSHDCLISFGGSRYSVPWQYAGKSVWLRYTQQDQLEVYAANGSLLARHPLNHQPGSVNTIPEHYAGLRTARDGAKALLIEVFKERFPEDELFLEKLLSQYKFNASQQLRRILKLHRCYGTAALRAAFQVAAECNTYSGNFLQGVLRQQAELELVLPLGCAQPIPEVEIQRGLEVYQQLAEGGSHD